MRGRGADDRIDVVASRLGHWAKANARFSPVRRVETADFVLLATVSLWALNFTVSKYILDHGFHPLSYSAVRYSAAALIFVAVTFPWERSLRIARSDWRLVGLERLGNRFWIAAVLSFSGVALVTAGSGRSLSGDVKGDVLALLGAATWGAYSVAISPLMRRYSPFRLSAVLLVIVSVPLLLLGSHELAHEDFRWGALVWIGFAFAVLGPL